MTAPNDNWQSCDGEVRELVSQLGAAKADQQRRKRTLSLVSTLAVLVVAGLVLRFGQEASAAVRPISCAAVRGQTAEILADTLDDEMQERVDAHLAYCTACRRHLDQARSGLAAHWPKARREALAMASR